ncbi:SDR family oxidoreductase [Mycolicibacterium sp. 120266]|uniref:SDR family oxidoreductase n=1 Tax=Mycolicibacterium sp. 120266 TaxID=3090601 RepID=UPI00299DC01E|nr:SDR family oxidoreductase [Mycolicibacterium sp. 120266]MDX1873829.1 SDR family oxidoreductase [Mycolicibacterium sp. 120266]
MTNVAVVTGGAGGMGLAAAHALGRDSAVLICDVDSRRLQAAKRDLREAGVHCAATACDITDRSSVAAVVEQAQQLGTVTSVVHTAGVSPSMGSADLIVRVNVVGTIVINEAFLAIAHPEMGIVNVASVAGHQLPAMLAPMRSYRKFSTDANRLQMELVKACRVVPRARRPHLAYVLSKNFVIWYSKEMAAHFGQRGARVVSVSPGSFDTSMGRLEANAGASALVQLGALKRFGQPSEIAELLRFCASDKAGYLTGTDIICDGGVMAAMTFVDMLNLARPR